MFAAPASVWAEPKDLDTPDSEVVENPAGLARSRNAGGDHGFLASHAETLPAGAVSLNFHEIIVFGISAGLTDRLSLSLTMTPPVASPPEFVALHAKYVLHRSDRTVVSLRITNLDLSAWSSDGYEGGFYSLGPGLSVDRFVGDSGRLSLHAGLSTHGGLVVAAPGEDDGGAGALLTYGVRFYSDFAAGDVALLRPIADLDLGPFLFGIPYLGLSTRF